jgi:Na+-transporting methylmalonyl-CoA/oxaloacetate decarboxylase gamma subunit
MEGGLPEALLITLVGMGLVVAAILLVAVLAGLLVRLTSSQAKSDALGAAQEVAERELRLRAATAAVATALAQQINHEDTRPQPFPLPPAALVSTWQAVQRANLMGQRRTVR